MNIVGGLRCENISTMTDMKKVQTFNRIKQRKKNMAMFYGH
jgi:hypothetical protein